MSDYKQIYYDKMAAGHLWLQYCPTCHVFIFYPRERCPYCLQADLEWKPVSGQGVLYSYTIVHVSALPEFKQKTPYIYALIQLDEGLRMPANLIDCPLEEVHVGMPVKLTYIEKEGKTLPVFKPGDATAVIK